MIALTNVLCLMKLLPFSDDHDCPTTVIFELAEIMIMFGLGINLTPTVVLTESPGSMSFKCSREIGVALTGVEDMNPKRILDAGCDFERPLHYS